MTVMIANPKYELSPGLIVFTFIYENNQALLSSYLGLAISWPDCFHVLIYVKTRARGSVVVKALCYKPEGRGFETR
jgi:hypothetical protein